MKVVRSSPLLTGRFYPQEFSWYSFLEAELTPEHMVPSVASEKVLSDTTRNRSRDPLYKRIVKIRNAKSPRRQILCGGVSYLWVLIMEIRSCHVSDTWIFQVAVGYLKHFQLQFKSFCIKVTNLYKRIALEILTFKMSELTASALFLTVLKLHCHCQAWLEGCSASAFDFTRKDRGRKCAAGYSSSASKTPVELRKPDLW
jgi:hypothetical protein